MLVSKGFPFEIYKNNSEVLYERDQKRFPVNLEFSKTVNNWKVFSPTKKVYKKNFLRLIRFLEVGRTKNISVWSGEGLVLPHSDQNIWVQILPWPICQGTELLAWRDEMIPVFFWEGPENHTTRWTKLCNWKWIGKNV